MKRFLAILLTLLILLTFVSVKTSYGVTKFPSEITLKNKVGETLYYFDPVPNFSGVVGSIKEDDNAFVYKMGEIIEGELDENVDGSWIVALEKLDGTVVDEVSVNGGKNFSMGTGNVPYDGKYKLVATDSLDTALQTWLISTFVYIKYNVKVTEAKICHCSQETSTITGYVTRGNNQPPAVPLRVCVAYPDGSLAAVCSIPANSSGQFTLSFPSTTDLWYYHLYISDGYPSVSPDNDAMVYANIANFSNIKWTLKPLVINPLLYDDEKGNLNQSLTLYLYDQNGKPVTGKKEYFYVGSGWTGYDIKEIAPGVYKIYGGTLKGSAIAIYVKQAIRSNIITISLHKLDYFNPYIHLNCKYSSYYDYTLGKFVKDTLPPQYGMSFEAEIGLYPVSGSLDSANGKFTYKQDYYVYREEVSSFTGVETHKIGPDSSGSVWNDPEKGVFEKPVYFVDNPGNISFTVSAVIWKRSFSSPVWNGNEPDPLSVCCVYKPDYIFKFNDFGTTSSECTDITISPDKVTVGEKNDLRIHVGNVNTIIHIYMINKNGEKVANAFTASFKDGREEKTVDDLWYNPGHITSTNISELPVSLSYQNFIDARWVNGDVVFKNVIFNVITVCPHCPRSVIVEVYRGDGQTHPLCTIVKNAIEVDPVIKRLSATYRIVSPGSNTSTNKLLAGLMEYIYVTVHFSYSDINWFIEYNGKPLEDYGLHFTVEKVSEAVYKIVFDRPIPYDENYSPNSLVIQAFAVNSTKTVADEITLHIPSETMPEDTIPPKIEISYPREGALLNKRVITIKGKVTDNISVSKLLVLNAEASFDEHGDFNVPVSLREGKNSIIIEAFDAAGNKTKVILNVTVDTIPPKLVLEVPQITNKKEITIKGKTEKGATVLIGGHAITAIDGTFETPTITLHKGINTFTFTAIDKAGNKTTKTITITYKPRIIITLQPDNPYMTVNGIKKEIDPGRGTKPVIIKSWGRTVVPIRAIVEALGGTISWDPVQRMVTIQLNGTTIKLWIGKPQAEVNGEMKWIDENNHNVKPIIVNGRTMLPLRFVAENLGCEINWDPDTRTITLKYGG